MEGFPTAYAKLKDGVGDGVRVGEHISGSYAHNFDALFRKPGIPDSVTLLPVLRAMGATINLKRQLAGSKIEIEDVTADRMLPTNSDRTIFKPSPEQQFR